MDGRKARFEAVCRLMNNVLETRGEALGKLKFEDAEVDLLIAAVEYYRNTVDPSSGDVIILSEFPCPSCGSCEKFRAQERQVSEERKHPEIGVEVIRVHGIAQCTECKCQVRLNQFEPVKLDGSDREDWKDDWKDLYNTQYQNQETVEKLPPRDNRGVSNST